MALIKCKACGTDIAKEATACPKCGQPNKQTNNSSAGQVFGALALGAAAIWWFAGGGLESQTASSMAKIEDQVAVDAVNQYNIAKRQGDAMQICVQAGFVSAAYLQAKDEANYQSAKRTEAQDCEKAGVPR
ncbi:hypothetical protein [Rhodanobacter ginsengiterrae]|uniref:hypothetical protein n=1 Tax=Rhodanobacter ginsengiterrae TaxID=2008451 RepID=UPI003CF478F6